jgi:DNA-binding response OmpR family regulator
LLALELAWLVELASVEVLGPQVDGREADDVLVCGDAMVARELVVLDLQIGNMGGVATCLAIRNEESGGRLDPQQVLLLLDRTADEYLAKQCNSNGWLIKPLDALGLRRAVAALHA